jgi:2-(1,2-epoxy-1,2-dihydrophenyl)acetyl-CoA isomerase
VIDQVMTYLVSAPTKGLARTKQAIYASQTNTLDRQLDLERDFMRELGKSHDYHEGVVAFLEKRAPRFTGE